MKLLKLSRTFMPEIIAPGTGLSPLTDKSIVPTNNIPTIQDILDGTTTMKDLLPGGGGDWSSGWGEDDFKSFKETGDDYKRKERDLGILFGFYNANSPKEEWVVKVKGGTKTFDSLNSFLDYKRKMQNDNVNISYISRTKVAQNNTVNVVADTMEASFKVESIDAQNGVMETGECFCVAKDIFITCAHVVKKYDKNISTVFDISEMRGTLDVSLVKDNQKYKAEILAMDAKLDVAMLKCDVACDILGIKEQNNVGDEIFAIGSPHGFSDNVSFGHIGALDKKIYKYEGAPNYMFLDLSVFSGNSGGPVLSSDGKVVAMVTAIVAGDGEYGLNAGLPISNIKQFCASQGVNIS